MTRPAGPAALAALALLGTGLTAGLPAAQAASQQPAGAHVIPGGAEAAAPSAPAGSLLRPDGSTASLVTTAATVSGPAVAPVGKLMTADVMIVSHKALPAGTAAKVARLPGVQAARAVDAARIQVNGKFVAMLGVDPSTFRDFAAGPTARSSRLWRNVAAGGMAVSYTMGQQDKLPLGGTVQVAGRKLESLRVGGFGTVGIGGVDAVVSAQVARSLGFPVGNAIMVSAPHAQARLAGAQDQGQDAARRAGRAAGRRGQDRAPGGGGHGRLPGREQPGGHRPGRQRADHSPSSSRC